MEISWSHKWIANNHDKAVEYFEFKKKKWETVFNTIMRNIYAAAGWLFGGFFWGGFPNEESPGSNLMEHLMLS